MKEVDIKKQESIPETEVGSFNDYKPSEDKLLEIGDFLFERFKRLKNLQETSDFIEEKARSFKSYHMVPKKRELPFAGAANLSSPFSRIGVDSFHANVMASIFPNGTTMRIVPQIIQKDFARTAEKAAKYIEYVMNHEVKAYQVVDKADKRGQMYGIGYLEPHYVKEEIMETFEETDIQKVPIRNPKNGEVVFREKKTKKKKKRKVTKFDGTKIDALPVDSVIVSPFWDSIEEAAKNDVVFKVFRKSFYNIKRQSKGENPYYYKSSVDRLEPGILGKCMRDMNDLEQARALEDGFYQDRLYKNEDVDLAQAYFWYDVDGDDINEEVSVTFQPDTGVVLRVQFGPCRIVELVPRPVDGRLFGEGIPKVCERLDEEWENFHNTRSNAGQWENSFFGFYRAGGRFNPQKITIKPNHFYPVSDPREVVFPQKQAVGGSYFQEEQLMFNIFERVLAVDENFQGVTNRGRTSATETINVSQKSSIRFGNPFNRIIDQLNKLLSHVWELNQECAPDGKEFYVVGANGPVFNKMSKYDYNAKMKFSVVVSSVFDQQLNRDTRLLAYRLFTVNPMVQQHPETMWELSQETLKTLNIDISLPKPPQANVPGPFEVIEMIKRGEMVEPEPGIDVDDHIKVLMAQLNAPDIEEWETEAVKGLILYIDKAKILKQTLESANLNKSGIFPPNGMAKQPPVTANRNPTQKFNTMKVGEGQNSMMQNTRNANESMDNTFNQPI